MKFSLSILFVVCSTVIFCQKDTVWNVSISSNYAAGYVSVLAKPYNVIGLSSKLHKKAHTLIPSYGHKTIHGLQGSQIGLAYYRKSKRGYMNIDMFYSSSIIYPRIVLRSSIFYNLLKGVEGSIGLNYISYADGNDLQMIDIGGSYYFKSMMMSYNMKIPYSGNLYHRFVFRRILRNEKDYMQIGFSTGTDNEVINLSISEPLNTYAVQFTMIKTVLNKIQLRLSIGMAKLNNSIVNNQLFNYNIGITKEI